MFPIDFLVRSLDCVVWCSCGNLSVWVAPSEPTEALWSDSLPSSFALAKGLSLSSYFFESVLACDTLEVFAAMLAPARKLWMLPVFSYSILACLDRCLARLILRAATFRRMVEPPMFKAGLVISGAACGGVSVVRLFELLGRPSGEAASGFTSAGWLGSMGDSSAPGSSKFCSFLDSRS